MAVDRVSERRADGIEQWVFNGSSGEPVWPGEGQYLYGIAKIPTTNYITGPTYLLNWGAKTSYSRVRNEPIAFTEQILRMGRTPRSAFRRYTLK